MLNLDVYCKSIRSWPKEKTVEVFTSESHVDVIFRDMNCDAVNVLCENQAYAKNLVKAFFGVPTKCKLNKYTGYRIYTAKK